MNNQSNGRKIISEIFGTNTFNYDIMKEKLPSEVYKKLVDTLNNGTKLDMSVATAIAHSLKEWALSHGATHYCHIFHPLVRASAEKHLAFLSPPDSNSPLIATKPLERFDASELVQAEPDASSFPSGGLRSTFEARGYTAWDPTSPAFIMERAGSVTLYIPSIFISYNGEALDKKTPLLRSLNNINQAACALLDLLGKPSKRVYPTVGAEQEFFLISRELYLRRPDLVLTGRTLFGSQSAKGQKLEDNYLGSIPDNILAYYTDVEMEAYKLGIPIKTRHNEVAPKQFEIVPFFTHVNIASDQNALLMDIMKRIAHQHGLECLFHEKPFKGINGSGKHNNYSLMTVEGRNLLDPGDTQAEHLEFLLFFVAVIDAVFRHGDLIRSTVAPPGNDFRLGANEAPPGIISVYIGSTLTDILEAIARDEKITEIRTTMTDLDLGLSQLPKLRKDNSDRNRTSPFAFTGQKFEFRAVGASQSIAFPNTFLNAAIAESLEDICLLLKEQLANGKERTEAILNVIKVLYSRSKLVIFNGNNYDQEWIKEAAKRGLTNASNGYEAIHIPLKDENQLFLDKSGVLTKKELMARYFAQLNRLGNRIEIEAEVMLQMVNQIVIPAYLRYLKQIKSVTLTIESLSAGKDPYITKYCNLWLPLQKAVSNLDQHISEFHNLHCETDINEAIKFAVYKLRPVMDELREVVDTIEQLIPTDLWPMPNYIDLLHIR